MKHLTFIVAAMLCMACDSFNNNTKTDFSQNFPLEEIYENSLEAKWANKEVLASCPVDDMENDCKLTKIGAASVVYTEENVFEGKRALRYHTSLIDYDRLRTERSPWNSFNGQQGGDTGFTIDFDEPQDWSEYNRLSMWVYIHPSKNPNIHLFLAVVNEGTPDTTLSPSRQTNLDIPQGSWQNVVWEIDYIQRDKIKFIEIAQHNVGYDREMGEEYITIDFDKIELQKVEPDHYSGWNVPQGQFAFSHIGYRPQDRKVVLANPSDAKEFTLKDEKGKEVFKGKVEQTSNKGNDFAVLDFTQFGTPGVYTISYGDATSRTFPIDDDVWLNPMFSTLNFYYCQRCGFEVPGIHGVCHQDCRGFHGDEYKPVNGGWHDAGDLSQGFFRTAMSCYALMRNLEVVRQDPKKKELATRIAEEAAWGINWLMNTCFKDGYHIAFSVQRIYTDNIPGNIDDTETKAEFHIWENLLGTAVFLTAAECLDPKSIQKEELERLAVEKWECALKARKEWNSASYIDAAWATTASAKLYKRFGDQKYKDAALHFGRLLMACQEKTFVEGIPVAGYFYSGSHDKWLIHDSHVSFNEAPMVAMAELCETFPEEKEWIDWYSTAAIYSEYFIKRGSEISSPFDIVPNGVFRRSDYGTHGTPENPNYNLIQYENGTQLNENYAIRTFPIWTNHVFHGGTACQLSNSWAQAEAAALINDTEAMEVVQKQLEWVLGRNPFGQSLMYGVGYDFSPLFVYCTHNIVGALPVGVDSFKNDEPFWCATANATCKEIWVSPVSRFLGTLANFLAESKDAPGVKMEIEGNTVTATVSKAGKHKLELRLFNAESSQIPSEVNVASGSEETFTFNVKITDPAKPFVAALIMDSDTENAAMVTGTAL